MRKYVTKKIFSLTNRNTHFEGNNGIGHFSSVKNSFIGRGSYIGNRCHLSNVKIGRFCSIGNEVSVICGEHPTTECISTHPAFYSKYNFSGLSFVNDNLFDEFKYTESNYLISIGNDVWIGSHVSILQGITIGNGAIIATGAVVVKDVSPYEIVGGVPAKTIKKRFSDEYIDLLETVKWWNWSQDKIKLYANDFMNPETFTWRLKKIEEKC